MLNLKYVILIAMIHAPYSFAIPHVVFLNPARENHPFWRKVVKVAQKAADSLAMTLTIEYADDDRSVFLQKLRKICKEKDAKKYNFLLTIYLRRPGPLILKETQKVGLKTFFLNSDIPKTTDRKFISIPRHIYPHWIGHIFPDDKKGAYDLTFHLLEEAANFVKGPIGFVAISGDRDTAVATQRGEGFIAACEDHPQCRLDQLVYQNNWDVKKGAKKAIQLAKRHRTTKVFAFASDAMALRASELFIAQGKKPGEDVFIGGFDWQDEALAAIKAGKVQASMGGHFMESAWAMVLLNDYSRGIDFNQKPGTIIRSSMSLISERSFAGTRNILENMDRQTLDFRPLSKWYNGKKPYNFNLWSFGSLQKQSKTK